jgi:hypothetical protein
VFADVFRGITTRTLALGSIRNYAFKSDVKRILALAHYLVSSSGNISPKILTGKENI